ncbi:MAG: DUF2007 domain-containing protein [Chloroflexota bacterium]|nr:DUF2007 domain-containing protein [Chloroflexota bacterium]
MSSTPQDLMVVYTTHNTPEAHIVAGRLETHDIPTLIMQEPAGSALGIQIGILGKVRLLVRQQDYENALAILEGDAEPPGLTEDADQVIFDADQP